VVCLTQAGGFDSDCGVNGWSYLPTLNSDVYADDVFVTSDNRILVSGASDDGSIRPFVMRLNHNGTPDSSFATSGMWRGTSLIGRMYSVTIQIDGRILAAGGLDNQGTMSVGVIRLANTVVTPSTTVPTTTIAIGTSTTIPATTIPANQLPATGHDDNGLGFAMAFFGIGILLLGMRRRALR
jgi:LPXTG-motif cell wall-anchored protein